jgi:hypothetical protein
MKKKANLFSFGFEHYIPNPKISQFYVPSCLDVCYLMWRRTEIFPKIKNKNLIVELKFTLYAKTKKKWLLFHDMKDNRPFSIKKKKTCNSVYKCWNILSDFFPFLNYDSLSYVGLLKFTISSFIFCKLLSIFI